MSFDRIVDTHCHLLPGLDDGPADVDDAVRLAEELVAQGVGTVVSTPHWSRQFPTTREDAERAHRDVVAALASRSVDLVVLLASELTDVHAATQDLDEIRARAIGGRSALVEMTEGSLPIQLNAVTRRLRGAGLGLVVGHPERSRAVQQDPTALEGLCADGALLQVVAGSLVGTWGRRAHAAAWTLLTSGLPVIVASDAHDPHSRPPELDTARRLVEGHLGVETWHRLAVSGPAELLAAAV